MHSIDADIFWPTPAQFQTVLGLYPPDHHWVSDTETDGLKVIGPASRDQAWYAGFNPFGTNKVYCFDCRSSDWREIRPLIQRLRLVFHNGRFDVHAMDLTDLASGWQDTMLCKYRTNTSAPKSLDELAKQLRYPKIPTPDLLKGRKENQNQIHLVSKNDVARYMADDILFTAHLWDTISEKQKQLSLRAMDHRVEYAVQRMEARGVRLLTTPLKALERELAPLVAESEAVIRDAGYTGNLASPKQLQEWLQGELKYDFVVNVWDQKKRRKVRKWSTDSKKVLQPYADRTGDPLIIALTTHRKLLKKKKDFCERLPTFMQEDGLVHGSIRTAKTVNTRFSHANPNLAQIPKRGTNAVERRLAKAFRSCFTGESGWMSGADYSQMELRMAAALSGDERLLQAFNDGEDPHAVTAAGTSGKSIDALPDGERDKAKAVNFGLPNGMKAGGLAVELRSTVGDAQRYIDKHKRTHPRLHEWMADVTDDAGTSGITVLLSGAVMYHDRAKSITNAVSGHISGNSADLMRRALVEIDAQGLRPVLSVHDELVGDVKDRGQEYAEIMRHAANNAYPGVLSDVDFETKGGEGRTWADV
jgi:DNA polymerase-1